MRLAVCIKWAPDPDTVEVDPVSGRVWEQRVVYRVPPADRVALEQALRLRDHLGGRVTVVTAGPPAAGEALRDAVAMGADAVLRVWRSSLEGAAPAALGWALAQAIKPLAPDLVLCGAQGHGGSGLVPATIAEALDLPAVTGVCKLELRPNGLQAAVERKLEQGEREVLECDLPALLSVDTDLCEPRYPGLPGVLQALATTPPVVPARMPTGAYTAQSGRAAAVRLGPARPRPRVIFSPDARRPVWQRVEQIVSGGITAKAGLVVEGSPEVLATRIEEYLRTRGLL